MWPRFEVVFGFGNAVLLANLPDVKTWYAWPRPRKEALLYYLDPDHNHCHQSTDPLGGKRSAGSLGDSSGKQVKRTIAKQVPSSSNVNLVRTWRT
jgi:hypothetical protein